MNETHTPDLRLSEQCRRRRPKEAFFSRSLCLDRSERPLRKSPMRSLHNHVIFAVWGASVLQTCLAFYSSAPARVSGRSRTRGQLAMVAHVEPVFTLLLADSAPSLR